eukprot:scaffold328090_cov55-Tisochrysis_lutea.AAC.2
MLAQLQLKGSKAPEAGLHCQFSSNGSVIVPAIVRYTWCLSGNPYDSIEQSHTVDGPQAALRPMAVLFQGRNKFQGRCAPCQALSRCNGMWLHLHGCCLWQGGAASRVSCTRLFRSTFLYMCVMRQSLPGAYT